MNTELKNKLLATIRSGEVTMKSRAYFIGRTLLTAGIAVSALLVSVFIINFISFSIRINQHEALLGFGGSGLLRFFTFFPWHLLVIDAVLLLLLQRLLRSFRRGYQTPLLYLIGGILVLSLSLGILIDLSTPLNDRAFKNRGALPPPFGKIYGGAKRLPQRGDGICRCTILEIRGSTLIVEDTRSGTTTLTVQLPANSPRATSTRLQVGDVIFIAGEEREGVIHAFGVKKAGR